ncbi:MAG: DUF692 family protein [Candidatus Omnitrophica bacterium]|nr:DUF692 family protein [Candidatus Omnitrophota bacterium]
MNAALVIAKYFLGGIACTPTGLSQENLTAVLTAELPGEIPKAVRVAEVEYSDGVVYIPYDTKEHGRYLIQIARKDSPAAGKIKGTPLRSVTATYSIKIIPQIQVSILPLTREFARRHAERLTKLYNKISGARWQPEQLMSDEWKAGQFGQNKDRVFNHKWDHSFVAVNKRGYPVGLILAYERPSGEMNGVRGPSLYIHGMAVDLKYRRLRVAAELIGESARGLALKGFLAGIFDEEPPQMSLQTGQENSEAQSLYEGVGFQRVGKKGHDLVYSAPAELVVARATRIINKPGVPKCPTISTDVCQTLRRNNVEPSFTVKTNFTGIAAVPCIDIGQTNVRVNFVLRNVRDGIVDQNSPVAFDDISQHSRKVEGLRQGDGFIANFLSFVDEEIKKGVEALSEKGIPVVFHIGVGATAAFKADGEVYPGTATDLNEIEGENLVTLIRKKLGSYWKVSVNNDGVVQVNYLVQQLMSSGLTGRIDPEALRPGKVIGFVPGTGFGAGGFFVNDNRDIIPIPGPQQFYDIKLPGGGIPDDFCGTYFAGKARDLGFSSADEMSFALRDTAGPKYDDVSAVYRGSAKAFAEVIKAVYKGNGEKAAVVYPEFWPDVKGARVFILGGLIVKTPEIKKIMSETIAAELKGLPIEIVYQDDILADPATVRPEPGKYGAMVGIISSSLLIPKDDLETHTAAGRGVEAFQALIRRSGLGMESSIEVEPKTVEEAADLTRSFVYDGSGRKCTYHLRRLGSDVINLAGDPEKTEKMFGSGSEIYKIVKVLCPDQISIHLGWSAEQVLLGLVDDHDVAAEGCPVLARAELMERIVRNLNILQSNLEKAGFTKRVLVETLDYHPGSEYKGTMYNGAYEYVTDPDFVKEVLRRTKARLLIDCSHVLISAKNRSGLAAERYMDYVRDLIDPVTVGSIDEIHLAVPEELGSKQYEDKHKPFSSEGRPAEEVREVLRHILDLREENGVTHPVIVNLETTSEHAASDMALVADELAVRRPRETVQAENLLATLMVLGRKAQRENKKLVIGIETDWIPGYKEKGSLEHEALFPLIEAISGLEGKLRKLGIDNVELIHCKSAELARTLLDKIAADHRVSANNMMVLASEETLRSDLFRALESTETECKAFIGEIDPTDLKIAYDRKTREEDKKNVIETAIYDVLSSGLDLMIGKQITKGPSTVKILHQVVLRKVTFKLFASKVDFERFRDDCARAARALIAA